MDIQGINTATNISQMLNSSQFDRVSALKSGESANSSKVNGSVQTVASSHEDQFLRVGTQLDTFA